MNIPALAASPLASLHPTSTGPAPQPRNVHAPLTTDGLALSSRAKAALPPPPGSLATHPTMEGSAGTRAAMDLLKLANVSWAIFRRVSSTAEQIGRASTNAPPAPRVE